MIFKYFFKPWLSWEKLWFPGIVCAFFFCSSASPTTVLQSKPSLIRRSATAICMSKALLYKKKSFHKSFISFNYNIIIVKYLLHYIKVHIQIFSRTSCPVLFVAHQQNIRPHLSQARGLQKRSSTILKICTIHQRIKCLNFIRSKPGIAICDHGIARFIWYWCLKYRKMY